MAGEIDHPDRAAAVMLPGYRVHCVYVTGGFVSVMMQHLFEEGVYTIVQRHPGRPTRSALLTRYTSQDPLRGTFTPPRTVIPLDSGYPPVALLLQTEAELIRSRSKPN